MIIHLIFFIGSLFLLWYSANQIVDGISAFSKKSALSSFAVSFFILGMLTSIPELSIGVNAVIHHTPEIFVGNLIGASFVLYMLVIPVLALLGGGIRFSHEMSQKALLLSLIVGIAPVFLILDGKITRFEGFFITLIYGVLFYTIGKRKNITEKIYDRIFYGKKKGIRTLIKIIAGCAVIFGASKVLVDETIYFSLFFHTAPFLISLLLLSVATNVPELSIAVASVIKKNKEAAFGDYIGSAGANSFLFGLLTLVNGDFLIPTVQFNRTFMMFIVGVSLFFIFTRTKRSLSRREGIVLLFIYLLFILVEVVVW